MAVCSHVLHIVAMEVYDVLRNQMDKELMDVLKKFVKEGCYSKWTKVKSCDCHVIRNKLMICVFIIAMKHLYRKSRIFRVKNISCNKFSC